MDNAIVRCTYNESEKTDRVLSLYDTTLRDGEQTLGVAFNRYQKLEIAQRLEEAGIPRIECGMPIASTEDAQAVELIVNNVKNSQVFALCRCVKGDIDKCLELGVKNIICELPISELKQRAYNLAPQQVLDRMIDAIGYAKEQGMYVLFFGIDATRTSLEFLKACYTAAVNDAHADEVVLVDTLGIAAPSGIRNMIRLLKSWISVPIGVHCHEDMSHGVACSLAAFLEGADEAHVTVNGLGERTGNVDIAALSVAAKVLYDINCTVDYGRLCELSRCVEKNSGFSVPRNKPVIGSGIFVRESGLVISQMIKYPPAVEPFDPAWVGAQRGVALGKNSGSASIEYMLLQYNITVSEDCKKEILSQVKALGSRKGTSLNEDEFLKIVKQCSK